MLPAPTERSLERPKRGQIDRVGVRVREEMVEMIVTGAIGAGELMPPEQALCDEFGVSRTVIRESVKRLQEKGLVVVTQGRGTQVRDSNEWNVLDPEVFDALVRHDESLGVLDEVAVVRAALEGIMASEVAKTRRADSLLIIRRHLEDMQRQPTENPAFFEADMQFHLATMEASRNRTAANIARSFFVRPRQSLRWEGKNPADAIARTLAEHESVYAAMEAGDPVAARVAMEDHILGSWRRRRLPDGDHHLHP